MTFSLTDGDVGSAIWPEPFRAIYRTFDAALARFRLMPEQPCDNPFISSNSSVAIR